MADSTSAQSSTARQIGPILSIVQLNAIAPVRGTKPNVGRNPVQPHRVEGEEIDFVALFDTSDHLLRRARRIDRLMNWFSRQGSDAVSAGLRHYRAYPWSGRVLRIASHLAEVAV